VSASPCSSRHPPAQTPHPEASEPATFEDLRTFVLRDGWIEEPNLARGRAGTGDQWRFRKESADGTIRRTKVPHCLRDEIGADLFGHILRDQLGVTEDRFWAVVRGSATGAEPPPAQAPALPGWLVERLLLTVGLGEDEIRAMTTDEARAAWEACRARPRGPRDDGGGV
jgi:hypothetical protein